MWASKNVSTDQSELRNLWYEIAKWNCEKKEAVGMSYKIAT